MDFPVPNGLALMSEDIDSAEWLDHGLFPVGNAYGWPVRVGSLVPPGFETCARICHSWDETDLGPQVGSLSKEQVARLRPILADNSGTPESCWFCLWDGFGFWPGGIHASWPAGEPLSAIRERQRAAEQEAVQEERKLSSISRVGVHRSTDGLGSLRSFFLFHGGLMAVSNLYFDRRYQSPNYWWPDDRLWCVVTDIDARSTYVAGDANLLSALRNSPLNATEVSREERLDAVGSQL